MQGMGPQIQVPNDLFSEIQYEVQRLRQENAEIRY